METVSSSLFEKTIAIITYQQKNIRNAAIQIWVKDISSRNLPLCISISKTSFAFAVKFPINASKPRNLNKTSFQLTFNAPNSKALKLIKLNDQQGFLSKIYQYRKNLT